jgi:deoxyribose-phosphate aldolase
VNFPDGGNDIAKVLNDTQHAINFGANEVDLVFPCRAFMNGNVELAATMIKACKQVCGEHVLLKLIIESGVLKRPALIESACQTVIAAGADFIKTSTGKVKVNATLEAAAIILGCIKSAGNGHIGFKAAGGISSVEEAEKYLTLAEFIMGPDWLNASHFRFGASSLLDDVLRQPGTTASSNTSAY